MRNEMIVIFFSIKTSLYMYYLLTTIYAYIYIYIQYYTLGCVIVKAVLAKQAPSMNANYIM